MRVRYPAAARIRLLVISVAVAVALAAMSTMSMSRAWASTTTILYTFAGGSDGERPQGAVVFDSAGNLYGTTTSGGASDGGTVYKLTPSGSGWTKSTIHTFSPATGTGPQGPLAIDGQGRLYGITYQGGAAGLGAVFRMTPGAGGTWSYSILYSFSGGADGQLPTGGVTLDASGTVYGTASRGGTYGQGVVFKLTPNGGGWTQTVLHHFQGGGVDGRYPGGRGALVFDQAGSLYGATVGGGSVGAGVVFRLTPSGATWTETVLHHFAGGTDGANPAGSTLLDAAGNIYGTTGEGGASDNGTVYKLTKSGSTYSKSTIYDFVGGASGHSPFAGVIADPAGNLYGTTAGGVFGAGGVVYKLAPSGGTWTQSVLYTFNGAGVGSYAELIRDSAGNLYGTNAAGGPNRGGEVFKVTP